MTRCAWILLALTWLAFLGAGSLAAGAPPPEHQEQKLPALLKARPIQPDSKDDELHRLLKERYNEAVAEMAALFREFQTGHRTLDTFHPAGRRLLKAGLELKEKPADKVALLEQYLELEKDMEKIATAMFHAGRATTAQLHQARYYRMDTEIRLLRAKQKARQAEHK